MVPPLQFFSFFFFNDTATTEIYTLSLHDALPISYEIDLLLNLLDRIKPEVIVNYAAQGEGAVSWKHSRSEEHTSELQSRLHLVCRLLLEKKKKKQKQPNQQNIRIT